MAAVGRAEQRVAISIYTVWCRTVQMKVADSADHGCGECVAVVWCCAVGRGPIACRRQVGSLLPVTD
jgi:hypothetical protein